MGILMLAVAALVSAAVPARADYETGAIAARNGDYLLAAREWRPLAERGHARAQIDLGFLYARGYGVPKDEAEAARLYRLAAAQGLPLAQFNLGYMYMYGQGVPQDEVEGLHWYRLAAERGSTRAQFNLGVRLYKGQGLEADSEAYLWFALAANAGHERAREIRDQLARALDPAKLEAANARVESWQPTTAGELPAVSALREPRRVPAQVIPSINNLGIPMDGAFVQLGSLVSREAALSEWQRLPRPHADLLDPLEPRVERADLGRGRVFYRLRAGPLADPSAAEALCARLRERKVRCLPVPPPPQ